MLLRTCFTVALAIPAAVLIAGDPAPLPHGATSLGGAATSEALFVYGGHLGPAHEYSKAMQSGDFRALNFGDPSEWSTLPGGPKLQGLALAAHDGKVYRLGGFSAVNSKGKPEDLQGQDGVAMYDPKAGAWKSLPDLPEPRSSFDAAVLGKRIYVIGGWTLGGGQGSGEWLDTAWSADLTKRPLKWEPVPKPPFHRRAVAVEAYQGKIYVIGGMSDEEGPTRRVDVYDPQSQEWSQGPDLLGEKPIDGFGAAAAGTDSGLYVSSLSRHVQRLSDDGSRWESIAKLEAPRFFHQMVAHEDELWLVGGANMVDGKLETLEVIKLKAESVARSPSRRSQ